MKLKLILLLKLSLFVGINLSLQAQSGVAISENTNQSPDQSAILDVVSTSKGMLVPRMSSAQRNGISSPATGLLIYQVDNTPGFYYYDGTTWQAIGGGSSGGSETDPKVSSSVINRVPVWNGSTLVDGSFQEDNGVVTLLDDGGNELALLSNSLDGNGIVEIYGTSGNANVTLGNLANFSDNGFLAAQDAQGTIKAALYADDNDSGVLSLRNSNGESRVFSYIGNEDDGRIFLYGPNGNPNVGISSLTSDNDYGYIGVLDDNGVEQAALYIDNNGQGQISLSGAKNFKVPHPNDPTKDIWYTSLEGPEAAMYVRGTATLVNGEATIELPEHFSVLAAEKGITVLTSPLSADSKGLAIVSKSTSLVTVKELFNGTGNYEFDWEVKCVRRGYEDYEVVRPRLETGNRMSSIPLSAPAAAPKVKKK